MTAPPRAFRVPKPGIALGSTATTRFRAAADPQLRHAPYTPLSAHGIALGWRRRWRHPARQGRERLHTELNPRPRSGEQSRCRPALGASATAVARPFQARKGCGASSRAGALFAPAERRIAKTPHIW